MAETGLDIVLSGISARQNALFFDIPVPDGCLNWHFFGDSVGQSAANLREGGDDATVIGSPTVADAYIGLRGRTNYLELPYVDPAEGTYIVVTRATGAAGTTAETAMFIGNSDGSSSGAYLFQTTSGTSLQTGNWVTKSGAPANDGHTLVGATPVSPNFGFIAARFSTTENKIDNKTLDLSTTEAIAGSPSGRVQGTDSVAIGGGANASFYGPADYAFAAAYDRVLTDEELTTIYATVKSVLAKSAITI